MTTECKSMLINLTIDESGVKFEAVKGSEISLCIRYCIDWLHANNRDDCTLTFNDIDLTIRKQSFLQDKLDEYFYKSNVRETLDISKNY